MSGTISQPPVYDIYVRRGNGIHTDGSDITTAFQAMIDANASKTVRWILDFSTQIDSIGLYSDHSLIQTGGVITKRPFSAGNTSKPVITNKHWVLGTIAPGGSDYNIKLSGLRINGNRHGGGSGAAYVAGTNSAYQDANGYQSPSVGFYGVTGVTIEDCYVTDTPAYAFHMANVWNGQLRHVGHRSYPGDTDVGQAIVQHQGWCLDCHTYGMYGTCTDDPFSFNANDGNDATPPLAGTFRPGTVIQGNITDCSVQDAVVSGGSGGRCLSSNPSSVVQKIRIENCKFYGMTIPFVMDNFLLPLGKGSYDNITLRDNRYEPASALVPAMNIDNATINNLVIENCQLVPPAAYSSVPLILTTANSAITNLECDKLKIEDSSGHVSVRSFVELLGTVTLASFSKTVINRGTTQLAQPAIKCAGTIDCVQIDGGYYDHVDKILEVTAGTTACVQANGPSHTNANGHASFVQSGGTFTLLLPRGVRTASLNSGTIGTVTGS